MALWSQSFRKPIALPASGDSLLAYSVDGLLQYGAPIRRFIRALLGPYTSGSITHTLKIPPGVYVLPGVLISNWVSTTGDVTIAIARFQNGTNVTIYTKIFSSADVASGIQLPQMPLGNDCEIRVSFSQATNLGFLSFELCDVSEVVTSVNS